MAGLRFTPSRLLCNGDHLAPLHPPITKHQRRRSLSPSHLSLRGQDSPDIRNGIRQPTEAQAAAGLLVLRLQDQLCSDRYFRQPFARHRARSGGSRVLQVQAGGVSVDAERGLQECFFSGFLRQVAGHFVQFSGEFDREAIGVDRQSVEYNLDPERLAATGCSHDWRVAASYRADPRLL